MAEKYKFSYFNIRGLGEPIRLIFAYAKVEYEDNRIEKETWPALKEKMPWGKMPVLEVNGEFLSQSNAIARYLGKKFNMNGDTEWEAAKCDEWADSLKDLIAEIRPVFREEDQEKKEAMKVEYMAGPLKKFFSKLDEQIGKNGGMYLIGKRHTWADMFIYNAVTHVMEFFNNDDALDEFSALGDYLDGIFKVPQIKTYIARRPFSPI